MERVQKSMKSMKSMKSTRVTLVTVVATALLGACLCVPASSARADQLDNRSTAEHAFAVGIDAALIRPLGTIAVGVGFAFFLPAAALTSPNGKDAILQAWQKFVLIPAQATFERPLGEF